MNHHFQTITLKPTIVNIKTFILSIGCWISFITAVKSQHINITIPANPPKNIAEWASSGTVFSIAISGTQQLGESRMLVFIKGANGELICGNNNPSFAQPTNIVQGAPKMWAGQAAISLLEEDCSLPTGSYELCVQVFGIKNREGQKPDLEKCQPFEIRAYECSPPNNISPRNDAQISETDFLKPVVFNWSPFVQSGTKSVLYKILVWEVEEGQTSFEALYNNFPIVDKTVRNTTNFVAVPGTFERRSANYVWRVTAINEKEEPLCTNAQSEPSIFAIRMEQTRMQDEDNDSITTDSGMCCSNTIIEKGKTIAVNNNIASIEQKFNISPENIRHVSVEIISIEETTVNENCNDCSEKEDWVYKFISHNTASWNGGTAWNASPVNGSSYYPSRLIEWNGNEQGDLKFNLKIYLPEKTNNCSRTSKVCLRYKFTDSNCVSCEEIICYDLNN